MGQGGNKQTDADELRRKAGRLLFVGLPGTGLDKRLRDLLREVLGGRVLIGVDQEGGLVDRFRDICEPMPSAKSVRLAGRTELARKFGELSARALRLLGFNMNFAPVLDLKGGNEENGLRGRTFGETPEEVARLAGAYLDGLQAHRIVGCGKHFPGLGGSQVDSHRRLPVVTHSWPEILEHDLVPFLDLMQHRRGEQLHSVMVSHAAFPEVSEFLQEWFRRTAELPPLEDFSQVPATISNNVVMRMLRTAFKYDGLVITDDMEMGAVVQTLSVAEASLRAIEAGSDMILICENESNFVAARDRLVEAMREERLSERAVNAAIRRMDRVLALAGAPGEVDAEKV